VRRYTPPQREYMNEYEKSESSLCTVYMPCIMIML
jgi:hypothetical protein